jgi:hypothetical protein
MANRPSFRNQKCAVALGEVEHVADMVGPQVNIINTIGELSRQQDLH